jgi:DNA-directed RNA polymerase specialized sigma subunit
MAKLSKQEIIKLQKTLKTDAAIGKKYGISRQAVHQLRQKYDVGYNRLKNKERNEKISSLYKKKVTGIKIAKEMDLSVSQVYRILTGLKKK